MLEMAGGMVVADRYCFGSMPGREEIPLEEGKDVLQSIADYYMWRNQCPRAMGPENIIARKKIHLRSRGEIPRRRHHRREHEVLRVLEL